MANHRQLQRDPKREARRQVNTINSHITSAQPRAQATPKKNIHIRGQGQATDPVTNDEKNSPPRRRAHLSLKEGVTSKKRATPKDPSNHVGQPPRAVETTLLPEPRPVTGKRGRLGEPDQVQHQNKRARVQPTRNITSPKEEHDRLPARRPLHHRQDDEEHEPLSSQMPPSSQPKEEEHQEPSTKKDVTSMNEAERMAAHAKKFAPGASAVKVQKSVLAKQTTPQSTTVATNNHVAKQELKSAILVKPGGYKKTLQAQTHIPLADEPTTIQKESRGSDKQFISIIEGPKNTPTTPSQLPSPSSSSHSSPTTKRYRSRVDDSEMHTRKKQRLELNQNRLSSLEQNRPDSSCEPEIKKTSILKPKKSITNRRQFESQMVQKSRSAYKTQRTAPVQANPNCKLKFFDYDNNSVPILHSASIEHINQGELTEKPSLYLRQEALVLLRRKLTFRDLGRKEVPQKIGPTRIIDDCDLCLRESKVYVATERGLLLAADYLQLLDVPETQPVRFTGRKPAWVKSVEEKFHHRRVERSYEPLTKKQKELGFISLLCGNTVIVFERIPAPPTADGKAVNLAYGIQLEDRVTGLFSYDHTCPMDWGMDDGKELVRDPELISWCNYDYSRLTANYKATMLATLPSGTSTMVAPISPSSSSENEDTKSEEGSTQNRNKTTLSGEIEKAPKSADSLIKSNDQSVRAETPKPAASQEKDVYMSQKSDLPSKATSASPADARVPAHQSDKAIEAKEGHAKQQTTFRGSQEDSQQSRTLSEAETYCAPVGETRTAIMKESSVGEEIVADATTVVEHGTHVSQDVIPAPQPSRWAEEDQVDYDDDEL